MANDMSGRQSSSFSPGKLALATIVLLIFGALSFGIWEVVPANKVVVIQSLFTGELSTYTSSGPVWQLWGAVTEYPKMDIYEFDAPIMFNDAGEGTLKGSVQWEMPLDHQNIVEIHTKYGSAEGVREGLINKVIDKCVYMSGPLMSSAESYASMKNYLIYYIEDQVRFGVYKTVAKDVKTKDPISGDEKTVKMVEIVKGEGGVIQRQEKPVLEELGLKTSNLAIQNLDYSEKVKAQIAEQQSMTMAVQTAMAEAKKAEQNFITITKNGEAEAARARWEQEKNKATVTTEAEARKAVAALDVQTAELRKQEKIKLADADAYQRERLLRADNALEVRGNFWLKAQQAWADAWAKNGANVVPYFQSGGAGTQGNGFETFLQLNSMKAARDLGFEPNLGKRGQ